jgi:hypothetical protein
MDPVTVFVISGFLGGVVIALFAIALQRAGSSRAPDALFSRERLSTDVINMAHIRVAGVGGLGLVAMAVVVAIGVPRIGQSLAAGWALGALFAVVLILWRRRRGPMPSSGRRAGANTTLSIDLQASARTEHDRGSSDSYQQIAGVSSRILSRLV